jgi:hypothetical protein
LYDTSRYGKFSLRSRNPFVDSYVQISENTPINTFRDLVLNRKNRSGVQLISIFKDDVYRYDLIGYLMTFGTPKFVKDLVVSLGFVNLNEDIHVFYNLLWYIYGNSDNVSNLNKDMLGYISGLSSDRLLSLFPFSFSKAPNYNKDKAAVLYAAMSYKS